MGAQNTALLSLGNVKAFRGHAVNDFLVSVTEDEFATVLNGQYGDAIVCNVAFAPGDTLRQVSPQLFGIMLADYHDELQLSLMGQLTQGLDVDIDFHD